MINVSEKEENNSPIEDKLEQLSKENLIILAKRKESYTSLVKNDEKLDWESFYNEIRTFEKEPVCS